MAVTIQAVNHHGTAVLDIERYEAIGRFTAGIHPPGKLEIVEVAFVDDAEIARVHGEFLGDPTPTDVISFDHGEILISVDTAERQAAAEGEILDRELALYLIHGILHLAGFDDREERERQRMKDEQERILGLALESIRP